MLKRKDIHLLSGAAAERSEEARKEAARKARPLLHSYFFGISVCVCGKEMCTALQLSRKLPCLHEISLMFCP